MKNLIYIITLCLPMLIIGQNEIQTQANFNGRHCRGTVGLCAIGKSDIDKNKANSTLHYDPKQGMVLSLQKKRLSRDDMRKAFVENSNPKNGDQILNLIVDGDFEVDKNILELLSFPKESMIIKSGNYLVVEDKDTLTIHFNVD